MLHHALLEQPEDEVQDGRQVRVRPSHTFRAVSLERAAPAAGGSGQLHELPALAVAMLMSALNAVSYGSLLFAFPRPNGTVVWLLSSMGTQLGTLLFSDIRNGISCPMLEMIPIFHAMFANVASKMPEAAEQEVTATCLAAGFVCTWSIGAGVLVITRFGLAKYLRAVPLIVLKGALFGVALFMFASCFSISSASGTSFSSWGPGLLLGLGLFALDEAIHSPVAIALSLLAIALTPSLIDLLGLCSLAEMQQQGRVFMPMGHTGAWYEELSAVYWSAIFDSHWLVILQITPTIVGVAASAALLMLMDLKAVELLTERDFSLDKELTSIGFSNLLSVCMGGGWPCYILCSLNVTCHRLGGRSQLVGLGLLSSSMASLFLVDSVVPRLPRMLPASLFMWLSLVFAKETIVDICAKYTHYSDVAIVAIMALVVKFKSFNDGLLLGTLLAMSMFTIRYSGSQAGVRTAGDARFYRSICTRDGVEHEALEKLGHLISVVHVDGFLMFGSTPAFTDTVRELLKPNGPEWILLNFLGLYGLDYSAALELHTLARKAREAQKYLVLTELRPSVEEVLLSARVDVCELPKTGPGRHVDPGLYFQAHYQRALQRCEDGVLARIGLRMPSKSHANNLGSEEAFMRDVLKRYFGDFLPEGKSIGQTLSIFSQRSLEPGSVLWNAGETCTYCACVTEGTLHAMQPNKKGGADRLISIAGPGDFLGFLAMVNHFPYEQTAVVPEEDDCEVTTVLVLEKSRYLELLVTDPPLAQALLRGFLRQISYEVRELSRLGA